MAHENVAAVEGYLRALEEKDLSLAPLAPDVRFEDPLTSPLEGREAVEAFLSAFLPALKGVRVERHFVDGEYVATMWEADTTFGVIPIFECFRVVDGRIVEARAYLDPRPFVNAPG